MVRIDRECASGELGRLAGKLSPLRHRQRVSIIREERGVVRNQRFGAAIGIRSLGVAPECLIRAREQDPSVRVVGTCLEPLREAVDHREDLLVGHVMRAALSARRSDRLGLAQQRVEDECCRRDQHQQGGKRLAPAQLHVLDQPTRVVVDQAGRCEEGQQHAVRHAVPDAGEHDRVHEREDHHHHPDLGVGVPRAVER